MEDELIYRIRVIDDDMGKLAELDAKLLSLQKRRKELQDVIKSGRKLTEDEAREYTTLNAEITSTNNIKREYNKQINNINKSNL